jgi:hypothetical protein
MRLLLTLFLFGSFVFYEPMISHPTNNPDMRGRITSIKHTPAEDERRTIGTVMVEAEESNAKVDRANLIITAKTHILKEQNDKRIEATFDDLRVGQLIEAQFVEGPTIMIYPLQVAAAEIVILNNVE